VPLSGIDAAEERRVSSGVPELDRVLGGGIVKRSAVLVGGEPGIGKSTLLLQMACLRKPPTNAAGGRALYVSGEESAGQIKSRADRLGLDTRGVEVFCSGNLDDIHTVLAAVRPVIVVVDSAQTLYSNDAGAVPGTVNQMKYCCFELINWVKEHDSCLFIVAHVTKEGIISGPKSLEHMVDTVLYFEQGDGDSRFLRASKNRFGSVDEIGIFTMGERGLSAVEDPSTLFLITREGELPPGIATAAVLEGSRPLLVELQALTVPAKGAVSRVFSTHIDAGRVSRVAATLEKSLKLRLSVQDIYVNVAGGMKIREVGVELPLAACLYSARTGLPLPARTAIAGELSLAAEVRPVRRHGSRVKQAANLGYTAFLGPAEPALGDDEAAAIEAAPAQDAIAVRTLAEAIKALYR
jgi:DNA repair protein RadA/Sms